MRGSDTRSHPRNCDPRTGAVVLRYSGVPDDEEGEAVLLAKIEISGKPREEREPNVIGGFLVVPLSEQPDEVWIRGFEKPADRMDFQDSTLRVPIVEGVRRNVTHFLDQLVPAIEKGQRDVRSPASRIRTDDEEGTEPGPGSERKVRLGSRCLVERERSGRMKAVASAG
jgi:hypothetical protein